MSSVTCLQEGDGNSEAASVVHCNVAEQVSHGLAVVDAANGLGEDHADVHGFDFWTLQLLNLVRNSVGHHHL